MKWSVVLLVVLGLAAAVGAAVLVASLRASPRPSQPVVVAHGVEGNVLVAARPLAAASVVDSLAVNARQVPCEQVPPDSLSDPAQVVGKVLRAPMAEGQAFTRSCFAAKGAGVSLAAAVREGMRAVSLALSDAGAMEGLLYPGSVVDVLASFKLPPPDGVAGREEIVSITLLRGVQVLAIEDRTVVSDSEESGGKSGSLTRHNRLVTVMVDGKQAELLQLASEYGTICLAMRNPLDAQAADDSATLLSQLSQTLRRPQPQLVARIEEPAAPVAPPQPPPATQPQAEPATWQMVLLRGGAQETRLFPMPETQVPKE